LKALGDVDLEKVGNIELFNGRALTRPATFRVGNGGSASTASPISPAIVKGASYNRAQRFRIMALTDQMATLTAYANDVSYRLRPSSSSSATSRTPMIW